MGVESPVSGNGSEEGRVVDWVKQKGQRGHGAKWE